MFLSKKQYWSLSLTWGIILSAIGLLVGKILELCGFVRHENLYGYYYIVGEGWGGFNMGPVTVVSKNHSRHTLNHEFGHSIQNCFFGPLMPFIVALPSAIRYWYREYLIRTKQKSYNDLPPYDNAWFEGMATEIGDEYYKYLNTKDQG